MIKFKLLALVIACLGTQVFAQTNLSKSRVNIGIEQDILPYVLGGYFANIWVGKGHLRSRVLVAHARKPDFLLKSPFVNNRFTSYAITADYFLKTEWHGWWIGGGAVLWQNSVQTNSKKSTVYFNSWMLNGSLGYTWKFYGNFYMGPWAGLHCRIAGDKNIDVDGNVYKPPLLNPEASFKVGWYF